MKSTVEIDVAVPRAELADLFADPRNNPKWMDDIARIEPVGGELGMPGSRYRLVPKEEGSPTFVTTVVTRRLPDELELRLDAPDVTVEALDHFVATSPGSTRLTSIEEFRFQGLLRRALGFLAQGRIRKAHRQHMDAFKRFAEHAYR